MMSVRPTHGRRAAPNNGELPRMEGISSCIGWNARKGAALATRSYVEEEKR